MWFNVLEVLFPWIKASNPTAYGYARLEGLPIVYTHSLRFSQAFGNEENHLVRVLKKYKNEAELVLSYIYLLFSF